MKPTPEQVRAAEAVVAAWELAEGESMRDGHRQTMVGLIARALAESGQVFEASNAIEESISVAFEQAKAQARREGAEEMREKAATRLNDEARHIRQRAHAGNSVAFEALRRAGEYDDWAEELRALPIEKG